MWVLVGSATELGFLGLLYGQLRNEMGWGGKGCGGGTSLTVINTLTGHSFHS